MSEPSSLAIIGISCLFPKADKLQAYWSNIKNGVDAITPIPERTAWKIDDYFDPDPKAPDRTYAPRGGFVSAIDFNPMEFGVSPKDIEATDTTQLLGMVAAKQALQDAGYADKPFNRDRTSVILGVTGALELVIPLGARLGHPIWRRALKEAGVAGPVADDVVQRISDSYVGWQENSFPGLLGNVVAGRIASRLDLGGTNCVVDAACAKLKSDRPCVTARTLIEPPGTKLHTLPKRLEALESGKWQTASDAATNTGQPPTSNHQQPAAIICECELVTRSQIEANLRQSGSPILNDLRRDLRLGMGPCQAGFCAYRAAGIIHETLGHSYCNSNSQLLQFLQERWKGERPVMWGHSLRSLELDLHIYRSILGVDTLPTEREIEVYPTERTS